VWIDDTSCLYSWSSDLGTPTFYIYQDAVLVETTANTSKVFHVAINDGFVIDVLDDPDADPTTPYPGRITLSWYEVDDTHHYLIQEYVASVWTTRSLLFDTGDVFYTWESRYLEDVTTHYFRIIPVGDNGNSGTETGVSWLMVRYPNPPDVTYSYDAETQKITITAN